MRVLHLCQDGPVRRPGKPLGLLVFRTLPRCDGDRGVGTVY